MRVLSCVLVLTAGAAHAATTVSQFDASGAPSTPTDLAETGCELDVSFRGAVAVIEQRQRFVNRGASALGVIEDLELPDDAHVIGAAAAGQSALAVDANARVEAVSDAVGADPVIVTALAPSPLGRPRVRAVVQPFAPGRELLLVVRYAAVAEIAGGALRVVVPGRDLEGRLGACHARISAEPGPGATVAHVKVGGAEKRTFTLDTADAPIAVELAFARPDPLAWIQRESLGDGEQAQLVTLVAPPVRGHSERRVLFVIDGSRSMELAGKHNVARIVRAIGATLAPDVQVQAIVFDREAKTVLDAWSPLSAMPAIETAIAMHTAHNGSDLGAALVIAHQLLASGPPATIIAIGDGVHGEAALADALALPAASVDVHAIQLEPGHMEAPSDDGLRALVAQVGGSYVTVPVDELDQRIEALDEWTQPAWLEVAVTGAPGIADQLRAGGGVTKLTIDTPRRPSAALRGPAQPELAVAHGAQPAVLTAHTDRAVKITAHDAPAAPIAQLALADGAGDDKLRARAIVRHPLVDATHALAVLSTAGAVARERRAMIAGGGPYTRIAAVQPKLAPELALAAPHALGGSAIDRDELVKMFQLELQPKAYQCYEHALVRDHHLAGPATFHFEIARGEVTRVAVDGLTDAKFADCLVEAGYTLHPPQPNPAWNVDDRTIANYQLTFEISAANPVIVAGDADSTSPLDIDAIEGGVPRPVKVDASTPLGGLRPSPVKE